ncbi:hypothetical protein C2G38_2156974 [Gigaspora rosea]|uniref:Uncharacterized protein n=1 Tax=Gigaspora rosea TaxID=44941 RepID=A0A397W295_9GLOM|nr:hypothetical protein C2G38_2156974 [Gigaspora rosea]
MKKSPDLQQLPNHILKYIKKRANTLTKKNIDNDNNKDKAKNIEKYFKKVEARDVKSFK